MVDKIPEPWDYDLHLETDGKSYYISTVHEPGAGLFGIRLSPIFADSDTVKKWWKITWMKITRGWSNRQKEDLDLFFDSLEKEAKVYRSIEKVTRKDYVYLNHCNKCGSDWMGKTKNPVQCPRCKRVDWSN